MANEKRLIDANALLEDFGEEPMVWNDGEAEIQERSDWHKYRVLVKLQPTVDAEPVFHGRWVKKTADCVYYYACSECGEPVLRSQWGNDFFSNYCPNCGAKMDGGNEK